jgi:hypothetical protein
MNNMTRSLCLTIALLIIVTPALGAVGSRHAMYVGGTVTGVAEQAEGPFETTNETVLTFTSEHGNLEIPYAAIASLEYGQKAGRRVAVAVLVSPFALFSKKRNHYLTISYTDTDGTDQAAIFELGKDIVRTTLTIVATRSGKAIEYQDEDARKSGNGR